MNPAELVNTKGALGAEIQNLLLKPPGFDPGKQYPGLLLVHGGPQSAWDDVWSYRWNAQMFAAHGYVVLMTNFHGSTGYGQKFVEEISGDWGGALLSGLDEGDGLSRIAAFRRQDSHGGGRGIIWRIHDQLDRRPHESLQGTGLA